MDGASSEWMLAFKEWGKLEVRYRGTWCEAGATPWLWRLERALTPALAFLTRALPFLPFNRNPFALFRSVRRRLQMLWKDGSLVPDRWQGLCWAEKATVLCAAVATEKADLFLARLDLKPGWNTIDLSLADVDIPEGAMFRLFPPNGETGLLRFRGLEITGAPRQRKPLVHAPFVKCVAWDLDNTVWRGILAEDGPEGVQLRSEVVDVIRALDARGIVHTIVSKNDHAAAWAQLERFGLVEYFVFPQINWLSKSHNLKAAARALNLGLDAFAFIDDSVNERGEVSDACPEVRVYAETDPAALLAEPCFNSPVSAEGKSRRLSYLAEMKRTARRAEGNFDRESFLRDCEIRLRLCPLRTDDATRRCRELVQRTNQLTLAARRYTEDEFASLVASSAASWAIRCEDRFGDYGIIGFLALSLDRDAGAARVAEFVMSCRVAKKLCEQSVLLFVARRLAVQGFVRLEADVVATGRNGALIEAFDAMPFKKVGRGKALVSAWRYGLDLKAVGALRLFTNPVEEER